MRVVWEICVKGVSDLSIFLLPPFCALSYHVQLFSPSISWWAMFSWESQSVLPQSYPCTIRGMSSGNHYSISLRFFLASSHQIVCCLRQSCGYWNRLPFWSECCVELWLESCVTPQRWGKKNGYPLLIFICMLNAADLTMCLTNFFTVETTRVRGSQLARLVDNFQPGFVSQVAIFS